ncbi:ANTAR domain-containing protein [Lachnospiraceae bacterium ZAX-1]
MNRVLIVSSTEKSITVFLEILSHHTYEEIVTVMNCGEARRLFIERDFDLCIINAPLFDEYGDRLALSIMAGSICQVILVVKAELYDEVSEKVEDYGVFTVAKPINKNIFWSALKLSQASYNKMSKMEKENKKLLQKIEDIRIVDRAKCVLIENLKMTEPQAHKHIEKQAMDLRLTKKTVAKRILSMYEQ